MRKKAERKGREGKEGKKDGGREELERILYIWWQVMRELVGGQIGGEV